jgi:hypothetical protein
VIEGKKEIYESSRPMRVIGLWVRVLNGETADSHHASTRNLFGVLTAAGESP